MKLNHSRWISRKEIAYMIGLSYAKLVAIEKSLGLDSIRVRINPRVIVFRREQALQKLKVAGLLSDDEQSEHRVNGRARAS